VGNEKEDETEEPNSVRQNVKFVPEEKRDDTRSQEACGRSREALRKTAVTLS
jgi:hypothetical protein